jgi:hypothetical protein
MSKKLCPRVKRLEDALTENNIFIKKLGGWKSILKVF